MKVESLIAKQTTTSSQAKTPRRPVGTAGIPGPCNQPTLPVLLAWSFSLNIKCFLVVCGCTCTTAVALCGVRPTKRHRFPAPSGIGIWAAHSNPISSPVSNPFRCPLFVFKSHYYHSLLLSTRSLVTSSRTSWRPSSSTHRSRLLARAKCYHSSDRPIKL